MESLEYERQKADALELDYMLGCFETHAKLTKRAESTLREDLERERERADQERKRAELLKAELREARKSFWRRLIGGWKSV